MSTPDLDTLDRHAVMGHLTGADYDAITKLVAEVRELRDEVDRLTWLDADACRHVDLAEEERDRAETEVDRLRAAIAAHRDDEKHRHIAYIPGDMKSVADERLWSVLDGQETTP